MTGEDLWLPSPLGGLAVEAQVAALALRGAGEFARFPLPLPWPLDTTGSLSSSSLCTGVGAARFFALADAASIAIGFISYTAGSGHIKRRVWAGHCYGIFLHYLKEQICFLKRTNLLITKLILNKNLRHISS